MKEIKLSKVTIHYDEVPDSNGIKLSFSGDYKPGQGNIEKAKGVLISTCSFPQWTGHILYVNGKDGRGTLELSKYHFNDLLFKLGRADKSGSKIAGLTVSQGTSYCIFIPQNENYYECTCKEVACEKIVKNNSLDFICNGLYLNSCFKQLQEWAKIFEDNAYKVEMTDYGLVIKLPESRFWNTYYRIGWLLLAIRVANKTFKLTGELEKEFNSFLIDKNFLKDEPGFTGTLNWQRHYQS